MSKYIITNCTVQDGNAVARNNASAFWDDPNWQYPWKHYTLDRLIGAFNLRTPRNLLLDREAKRHFKAVDPQTGALLGYIRWKLPPSAPAGRNEDGSPVVWPEGQTPDVGAEASEQFDKMAAQADWHPLEMEGDHLDDILKTTKEEFLAKKDYIGAYCGQDSPRDVTNNLSPTDTVFVATASPRSFCCPPRESTQRSRRRSSPAWHRESAGAGAGHFRHGVRGGVQAL